MSKAGLDNRPPQSGDGDLATSTNTPVADAAQIYGTGWFCGLVITRFRKIAERTFSSPCLKRRLVNEQYLRPEHERTAASRDTRLSTLTTK